jgi:uncharacterized membrane-anchored protein
MAAIADHPLRYALANELHARPFPTLTAPCRAAYLALKPAQQAASRDKDADRDHLVALLDRFGAPHPQPDATHYSGPVGRYVLKWESHTEFVTYTIFGEGLAERPFEGSTFGFLPEDWLEAAPGQRITSALIRIEVAATDEGIDAKVADWFVPESLAMSRVVDDAAVVSGLIRVIICGWPSLSGPMSAAGGWAGWFSGCARSRPTSRWPCWALPARASSGRGWASLMTS